MADQLNDLQPPSETSPFKIGGKIINVPVMSFYDVERFRDKIEAIQPTTDWIEYPKSVLGMVSQLLFPDDEAAAQTAFERMQRACSVEEMRQLGPAFTELLRASGFIMGEAQATGTEPGAPGTGTSTASSPTSQSAASAAETQGASSVH